MVYTMPNSAVVVENLAKRYDSRAPILDGISFSINRGEFAVVHGRSGCGKTTLLNILGGLDRPDSGEVMVDGTNLNELSVDALARFRLKRIGFVFQDFNLLGELTIRENVELPLRFSRERDEGRVDMILGEFDIHHIADKYATKVSGGEAQRTAIARAMMNNPRILLADEPTGNLDEENTANVYSMFERARLDFGTTIILATHDTDLARKASKRILLQNGKVNVEGRSE
jgi:ABC-type lipoprotein export system ATPase subunit